MFVPNHTVFIFLSKMSNFKSYVKNYLNNIYNIMKTYKAQKSVKKPGMFVLISKHFLQPFQIYSIKLNIFIYLFIKWNFFFFIFLSLSAKILPPDGRCCPMYTQCDSRTNATILVAALCTVFTVSVTPGWHGVKRWYCQSLTSRVLTALEAERQQDLF